MTDTQNNRGVQPRHGALNLLDGLLKNASIPTAAKARLRTIRLHLEAMIEREQNPAAAQEAASKALARIRNVAEQPRTVEVHGRQFSDGMRRAANLLEEAIIKAKNNAPVAAAPDEMSPEFTDTARAAIAWVLWHHQGGSSPIGQPLRFALGMGDHDPLPDWRIAEAKRYAELAGATTADFHKGRESPPDAPGIDRAALQQIIRWWNSYTGPVDEALAQIVARIRALIDASPKHFDMLAHLQRQRDFSEHTFGPGTRSAGIVDHIRKELREIEAAPDDLSEWIDVVILALDGAWRSGSNPQQIIDALVAKQAKNEGRVWPDWRTMPADQAIEHDRSVDSPKGGSDSARLDALEQLVDSCGGALLLHHGCDNGRGFNGIGLRNTGRTLRQAIDQATSAEVGA